MPDMTLEKGGNRNAGAGRVAVAVFAAVFAAFVLSWVYGPAQHYSPLIYLNLLLTYLAGVAVGKAAQIALKALRIDSLAPACLVALAGGAAMVWFSWLTYLLTITDWNFAVYGNYFFNPSDFIELFELLSENPVWTLEKDVMPPIFYLLIWAAEALMLLFVPVAGVRKFLRENARCESCGKWVAKTGDHARFGLPDDAARHLADFRSGDLSQLPELPRLADDDESMLWVEASGYACADCTDEDSFVNLDLVTLKKKKKELVRSVETLIRFAPVDVTLEGRIFEPPAQEEKPEDFGDMT